MVSKSAALVAKARFLSCQAKESCAYFQHTEIGYNYRMSNIAAGIGRGQMEMLPMRISQRRAIFNRYRESLSGAIGISFQEEPNHHYFSNRWLTAFVVNESEHFEVENFRQALEAENIEVRYIWKPMHLQPLFSQYLYFGSGVSDRLFLNGICLPSGSAMDEEDMSRIIGAFERNFSPKPIYSGAIIQEEYGTETN